MERIIIPAVVGLAPVLTLLLTWDPTGSLTPSAASIRSTNLPVLGAELFVIIIAFRNGLVDLLRRQFTRPFVAVPLLLLIAIAFYTASFIAPASATAWVRSIIWLIHLLFGFAVAALCGKLFKSDDLIRSYQAGFAIFVLLFIIFVLQVRNPRFDWTLDLPAVTHIRHLGYYAAAMIGLSIGVIASRPQRRWQLASFAICVAAFALAFWTGARGTVVAAFAAALVGAIFLAALRRPAVLVCVTAAAMLGATAGYVIPVPASHMGFLRTVEATTTAEIGVTTGRTDMWLGALDAIAKRPITGWGEGQMDFVAHFYGLIQPHNVILQVLLAWGMLGLLCIAILLGQFAWNFIPRVRDSAEILAPLMAGLTIAAYAMIDGTLFHVQSVSIFAASLGILAARIEARSKAAIGVM